MALRLSLHWGRTRAPLGEPPSAGTGVRCDPVIAHYARCGGRGGSATLGEARGGSGWLGEAGGGSGWLGIARDVGQLDRRASGRGARDSTKYGKSRTSARTYFRHHIQRIAMAAKLGDANAIYKNIQCRRQLMLQGKGGYATVGA